MPDDRILLAHGSGGRLARDLIREVFLPRFPGRILARLEDAAVLELPGERLAFTTDSYVVHPLFFPGGDIGRLAVCGTVNDLAVMGAVPRCLSCGFILEEGLERSLLERVLDSMRQAAEESGVEIVTGDTKVVERGKADGMFLNTAGIGMVPPGVELGVERIRPGDRVLLSGTLGEHGLAVLAQREGLKFRSEIRSDCAPLHRLCADLLRASNGIRFMRDPTRGGLAAALNEAASGGSWGIRIEEEAIPLREEVRGLCEILGLDPLYVANEGKLLAIADPAEAERILQVMRTHPLGSQAAIIGEVVEKPAGRVVLRSTAGGSRILDLPAGEPLPRIC